MNILLLSIADNGGGTYFLARAINQHTSHNARAIRWIQNYLDYPYDLLTPGPDRIRMLWDWADIIHIRDGANYLPDGLNAKPTVITYTGNFYRRNHATYHRNAKFVQGIITVSTPDLLSYDQDRPIWLPNARDDKISLRPRRRSYKPLVIHAPTVRADKGTASILKAIDGMDVQFRLIEQMRYSDCVAAKADGDILIDQFLYGYGNNAIESWALGIPVVSGALPQFMTEHERLGPIPFVVARENVKSIRSAVEKLCKDEQFYDDMVQRGREHFFKYHHSPVVARRAIEIYEMALSAGAVEPVAVQAQDIVAIQYLGTNCGRELWVGEISHAKYRFCKLHPICIIDKRDLHYFLSIKQRSGMSMFRQVRR